jgi:hypothetical protein
MGIPPSPDSEFRKIVITTSFVVAALVIGFTALMLDQNGCLGPVKDLGEVYTDAEIQSPRTESAERASACAAARRFVANQLDLSSIKELKWLDTRHEGHHQWYRFEGELEITYDDGETLMRTYSVVVSRDSPTSWKMGKMELRGE